MGVSSTEMHRQREGGTGRGWVWTGSREIRTGLDKERKKEGYGEVEDEETP